MLEKLRAVESRYEELCARSEQPDFYNDPKKAASLLREKNDLEPIIDAFSAYKARHSESRFWSQVEYIKCTALRRTSTAASCCVGCGLCEKHCPQGIAIRKELKNVQKELEGPVYRTVRWVVGKLKAF